MHSSRMRTVHWSGCLGGGGVCLGASAWEGVCLGGVAWGRLPGRFLPRGCLLEACLPRGVCLEGVFARKPPPRGQNDTQVYKHYLAPNFGNKSTLFNKYKYFIYLLCSQIYRSIRYKNVNVPRSASYLQIYYICSH